MTLSVQDIVDSLAASELYGTNMFESEDPEKIKEGQEKRMLLLVKQAVGVFYRKFSVNQKSVWLSPTLNQTEYLLTGQQPYLHQGFTQIDKAAVPSFEYDEYGLPIIPERPIWDDDLKKVRGIYTIMGERVPINITGRRFSVFLSAYNKISLMPPIQYRQLHILYDCLAPKLENFEDDTGLPETTLTALRYYIARSYYGSVTTDEGMKRLQFYSQQFESAIREVELLNQFETQELYFNREILKGKWN